jgi:hypothetical protein
MRGGSEKIIWQKIFAIIFISFFFFNFYSLNKVSAVTPNYAASRIEQSYPGIIKLQAGKSFTFWVKFKNVGAKAWLKDHVVLKTDDGKKSPLAHSTWPSNTTPYTVKYGVPVNITGTFKFALQAPAVNGLYWQTFNLYADNQKIPGGDIQIGVQVYGGSDVPIVELPVSNNQTAENINSPYYWQIIPLDYTINENIQRTEPSIRVGLLYETSAKPYLNIPYKIKAVNAEPYQIRLIDNDSLLLTQTSGEETTIDFDFVTKRYFVVVNGQRVASTDSPIKFLSTDPTKKIIFKITSWNRGPFWGLPCNDNEYRGTIEIKYNLQSDRLWLINELPIEDYMKGVAEVQDYYPEQSLKAQKVAARTYAYTRILIPKYTNVADEDLPLFDLRATQADQVYRGYLWEVRSPNIKKAAEETSGMVATYGNVPILAYYFARTDGRTRSGCEAGMTKECLPYLVSVSDPPGQGKSLLGHGVGMPQQSTRVAADQGASFTQILRYYYRGIDITRVW